MVRKNIQVFFLAAKPRLFSPLNTENTIYRSNHVSNNLILKGTLSKDKERLLREIDGVLMER